MEQARKALREELKRCWKAVPDTLRQTRDVSYLRQLEAFLREHPQIREIYAYYGAGFEPRTAPMLRRFLAAGYTVAIPACLDAGEMVFRRIPGIEALDSLRPGKWGLFSPPDFWEAMPDAAETALILTPGLGFAYDGRRMGRGGGYYDRFLARCPKALTVALCDPACLREELPAEAHDIPVQKVLLPEA